MLTGSSATVGRILFSVARSQIAVTDIVRGGLAPGVVTVADSVNGHYFLGNDGNVFFEVINSGAPATLTLNSPLEVDDLGLSELVIDIPAGTTLAGNFKRRTFNQSTDGTVWVDPSSSGTMEIRAFRATPAN